MASEFIITTKFEFAAAHSLRGYQGDCARVHGHNWFIELEISCLELNDIGIAIDFKDIKEDVNKVIGVLDHQYINEISPFDVINPTAENISKWFYETLKPVIANRKGKLLCVKLWENNRSMVKYKEI